MQFQTDRLAKRNQNAQYIFFHGKSVGIIKCTFSVVHFRNDCINTTFLRHLQFFFPLVTTSAFSGSCPSPILRFPMFSGSSNETASDHLIQSDERRSETKVSNDFSSFHFSSYLLLQSVCEWQSDLTPATLRLVPWTPATA